MSWIDTLGVAPMLDDFLGVEDFDDDECYDDCEEDD
jgi:hypothetical protein